MCSSRKHFSVVRMSDRPVTEKYTADQGAWRPIFLESCEEQNTGFEIQSALRERNLQSESCDKFSSLVAYLQFLPPLQIQ